MGYPNYSNRIVGIELHEAYSDACIHSLKEEIVIDIFMSFHSPAFLFIIKRRSRCCDYLITITITRYP